MALAPRSTARCTWALSLAERRIVQSVEILAGGTTGVWSDLNSLPPVARERSMFVGIRCDEARQRRTPHRRPSAALRPHVALPEPTVPRRSSGPAMNQRYARLRYQSRLRTCPAVADERAIGIDRRPTNCFASAPRTVQIAIDATKQMIAWHMIFETEVVKELRCCDLLAHHRLNLPQHRK